LLGEGLNCRLLGRYRFRHSCTGSLFIRLLCIWGRLSLNRFSDWLFFGCSRSVFVCSRGHFTSYKNRY